MSSLPDIKPTYDPVTGKPMAMLPRGTLAKKPAHGAPCNRCGVCCLITLCDLGQHVFGHKLGPCPALRQPPGGDAVCGLTVEPEAFAPRRAMIAGKATLRDAALVLIASGVGCDARCNGEPINHTFNKWLDDRDRQPSYAKVARRAKRVWGIK